MTSSNSHPPSQPLSHTASQASNHPRSGQSGTSAQSQDASPGASTKPVDVIILAAGKGTRMYSDTPKVLHPIAGKPMLEHVLDTAANIDSRHIHVVTGFQSERVRQRFADRNAIQWVEQTEQLGTGHAVMQAAPALTDDALVVVLYGDVPLVKAETLARLLSLADDTGVAVLTLQTDDPYGLGRIVRDEQQNIIAIVEQKDATAAQQQICEVNTGIMAFRASLLKTWLAELDTNNAQGEYYLTDTVAIACQHGHRVSGLLTHDASEVQGVNNRLQLTELERVVQLQQARNLAASGATVMDTARLDIRGNVSIGRDVVLDVNVILEGDNMLGDRVHIGPNVTLINCVIGDDCHIHANSHLENATVASQCSIGPFARLRPGTELSSGARIGNFVETKKTRVGAGSKINHLSYVGDTDLGEHVNIGAGTITCNYDGVNKHRTVIGSGAFIGSNTALVAPVNVGNAATIGAGSVITTDVGDNQLGVARSKQINIAGWKRPVKK